MSKTIQQTIISARRVEQVPGGYQVQVLELIPRSRLNWAADSKVYSHSTSAFAALGRLVQQELKTQNLKTTTLQNMKFIGEDGSLGYRKGLIYALRCRKDIEFENPVVISRLDGTGYCPYSSIEAFNQNWRVIPGLE